MPEPLLRHRQTLAGTGLLPGLALLMVLALTGCTDPAGALWEDYLQRLERLTGTELEAAAPRARTAYPRRRELQRPLPDLRTGMGRYFDLARCDMMGLVSRRNSVLSRVQEDSLRLGYELRFVALGQQCLDEGRLEERPEQQRWLEEILDAKRNMLPDLYWNLSLAGDEFRDFFSRGGQATASGNLPQGTQLATVLESMAEQARRIREGPLPDNTGHLEADLKKLSRSDAGGSLLAAMAVAEDGLNRGAAMLEATDPEALCPEGRPLEQARYLNNVFENIYGERVQPWLAATWREMDRLGTAVRALYRAQQSVEAEGNQNTEAPLRTWMEAHFIGDDSLDADARRAMDRHTEAWQRLLDHCDMAPGQQEQPTQPMP